MLYKHIVAISQFILSVIISFVFGLLGTEKIIGPLDFGFRLLLAMICSLVAALGELYFLAEKLNEDWEVEYSIGKKTKTK